MFKKRIAVAMSGGVDSSTLVRPFWEEESLKIETGKILWIKEIVKIYGKGVDCLFRGSGQQFSCQCGSWSSGERIAE
jgi:asparagine synthetase B (glutamine-hydrolysing)